MVDAEQIIERAEEQREQRQELLRPVAEFFHEHEGELFERYEAVDELMEVDSVASDDERLLHQVVGNLAADRVDPVQNVVRDSGKYVGVVDYDEHDYWYEYVEVDDVEGRMNVGVCAQCVKDATSDANVAKGIGTTEELADRIKDHYDEEHSESPDEVETGATLVSGTTIAGNSAITSATDGAGSGLDADTFQGNHASTFVNEGVAYSKSTQAAGAVISGFPSPYITPQGIGVDSNDSIWHTDTAGNAIYQFNQSGSVLSEITSPSNTPRGVGLDSSDSLWNVDGTSESIYQLNQSGTVLTQFACQTNDPQGLGVDSSDSIWYSDDVLDFESIYQLNQSGSVLSGFASPSNYPTGLGLDSSDSIWHADSNAGSIYQLNQSGSVLSGFASQTSSPTGLGVSSDGSLWNVDPNSESIYQLTAKNKLKYE